MDFTKAERRLKISHQAELPEKVKAWWFLRRSGITKEQRQLIPTNVGNQGLAMDEVVKAMSFILGQNSKTEGQHPLQNRSEGYDNDDLELYLNDDYDGQQLPIYYRTEETPEEEES